MFTNRVIVFFVIAFITLSSASTCIVPECQTKVGGSCNSTTYECATGMFCNNDMCITSLAPGSPCTQDYMCEGSDVENSACWNNVCTKATLDAEVGQPCNRINNCKTKYYCNLTDPTDYYNMSGSCVDYIPKGGVCSDYVIPCMPGTFCNNGVCVPMFSIAEGQPCSSILSYFSGKCAAGLYCQSGVCAKQFDSSHKYCNKTSDCPDHEYCACENGRESTTCKAPTTLNKAEVKQYMSLIDCSLSQNCNMRDPSCCNEYQCVVFEKVYGSPKICGDNPFHCDTGMSKGAKVGMIIGMTAGVIVVVVLIVFLAKRRNHRKHYAPLLKK